jgi:hypothetical protein
MAKMKRKVSFPGNLTNIVLTKMNLLIFTLTHVVPLFQRSDISRQIDNIQLDEIVTVKGLVCARPPGQKNVVC